MTRPALRRYGGQVALQVIVWPSGQTVGVPPQVMKRHCGDSGVRAPQSMMHDAPTAQAMRQLGAMQV